VIAYKLFRVRKDGTIGPLFINRRQRITEGVWIDAEDHPTKGYAHRPGWHCCRTPKAPHLSEKGRQWYMVEIEEYQEVKRPESQGGIWYLAKRLKVLQKVVDSETVA
jgi:hypothetical protein